jgi:hypothetical protein
MSIAEKQPRRNDVWAALLNSPYDPESAFARWLASHGDKATPFVLASATNGDESARADALVVLAQIVAFERKSAPARHLAPEELQVIEKVISAGLAAPEPVIRQQAVKGITLVGNHDDLAILDRIAATDPYALPGAGRHGETVFLVRDAAREASERLRLRLTQQPQ